MDANSYLFHRQLNKEINDLKEQKRLLEMEIKETPIEGVKIIKSEIFQDSRGLFFESYNKERYYPWTSEIYRRPYRG